MGLIKKFKDFVSKPVSKPVDSDHTIDYKEDILPFLKQCFQDIKDMGYEIDFINYSPRSVMDMSNNVILEKDLNVLVVLKPIEKIPYLDIVETEFKNLFKNLQAEDLTILDSMYNTKVAQHSNRSGRLNFGSENIFDDYLKLSVTTIQLTIVNKNWKKSNQPFSKLS